MTLILLGCRAWHPKDPVSLASPLKLGITSLTSSCGLISVIKCPETNFFELCFLLCNECSPARSCA